jgi:uncharacterized membrane protein
MSSTTISVERGEELLSKVLRAGVLLSAGIVLLGVVMLFVTQARSGYFSHGVQGLLAYPASAAAAPIDSSVADVIKGLQAGEPDAVISLGLLVLIATPIVRVAASVVLFLMQRDYRYVAITMFVLIVLLLALRGGTAG